VGLKGRRSRTDISTDSVLYLFDMDITEGNALRAVAGLPLLNRESQRHKENGLGVSETARALKIGRALVYRALLSAP
jgi:hypothetical protein